MRTIRQQLRSNAVALISLVVALNSLGYNTWRNERTEENRNIRVAAFEVLRHLGELQLVVNLAFFSKDSRLGHPMAGWGQVALISDLSQVLPTPAPQHAEQLHRVRQRAPLFSPRQSLTARDTSRGSRRVAAATAPASSAPSPRR